MRLQMRWEGRSDQQERLKGAYAHGVWPGERCQDWNRLGSVTGERPAGFGGTHPYPFVAAAGPRRPVSPQTPPVVTEAAFQQAQRRVRGGAEAGGGTAAAVTSSSSLRAVFLQQAEQFGVPDAPVDEPACERWGGAGWRAGGMTPAGRLPSGPRRGSMTGTGCGPVRRTGWSRSGSWRRETPRYGSPRN
ncbi:hypothetical protein GCM10019016_013230 [Streptomyces prasinosporus]|uniref:Uncharacterized protein n=1 Tax=Streptomyces prasinosporus TaxID=68256 RepID=A0ABP6TI13_9ACTN|nr:hypothetical protein GCM10010332_72320 [Streptomyces albogriseolus]